jgi:hypothetical protein
MTPLEIALGIALLALLSLLGVWVLYRTVNHGERLAGNEARLPATFPPMPIMPTWQDPYAKLTASVNALTTFVHSELGIMSQNIDVLTAAVNNAVAKMTADQTTITAQAAQIAALQTAATAAQAEDTTVGTLAQTLASGTPAA